MTPSLALANQLREHIAANIPADQVEGVLRAYIDTDSLPPPDADATEEASPYAEIVADTDGPSWAETLAAAACSNLSIAQLPGEQLPVLRGVAALQVSQQDSEQVPSPESGDTTSDLSNKWKKKCRGLRKDGQPCRAWALRGGDLCIYHEADAITNFDEARSRGGSASRKDSQVIGIEGLPVHFHNPREFHAFLEAFLRMQLAGSVPASQGVRILRTLRIIQNSFEAVRYRADYRDPYKYAESLETCIDACEEIGERLADLDIVERSRRIEDVGSSRREVLRANQEFERPKPARMPSPSANPRAYGLPPIPGLNSLFP